MRRAAILIALAVALGLMLSFGVAFAVDWFDNTIAVTATSQTIALPSCPKTVWVKNDGSTNEMFVCLWYDNETPTACVASDTGGRRLDPGEAKAWTVQRASRCWRAVGMVASAGETTTARGDSVQ